MPAPSADLDSCANGPAPSPSTDGCAANIAWVNGDLVANKANYFEGDSVPFRIKMGNVPTTGTHTLTLTWDTTKSGNHTFDYHPDHLHPNGGDRQRVRRTDLRHVAAIWTCYGNTRRPPGNRRRRDANSRQFQHVGRHDHQHQRVLRWRDVRRCAGDNDRSITITFSAAVANPVFAFGAHIASRDDWGEIHAAINVPGSPFHVESGGVDGQGGTQSHQVKLSAITFPGSITIIKDATPNSWAQSFACTASPAPLAAFNLVDDGTRRQHQGLQRHHRFPDLHGE